MTKETNESFQAVEILEIHKRAVMEGAKRFLTNEVPMTLCIVLCRLAYGLGVTYESGQ